MPPTSTPSSPSPPSSRIAATNSPLPFPSRSSTTSRASTALDNSSASPLRNLWNGPFSAKSWFLPFALSASSIHQKISFSSLTTFTNKSSAYNDNFPKITTTSSSSISTSKPPKKCWTNFPYPNRPTLPLSNRQKPPHHPCVNPLTCSVYSPVFPHSM